MQDARGPDSVGAAGVSPASATTEGRVRWRSRGYLPQVDAAGLVQHVIFRLADSLPLEILDDLARRQTADRIVAADSALDNGHGRRDLGRPSIARLVQGALLAFDGERYALISWCIMPNHVHVLLETRPGHGLHQILHSWKSYTAKAANRTAGRSGPFWAPEYFDRFMRDDDHLARTVAYIEGNPVRAGLCDRIEDWQFSSAWQGSGGRDARGPNPTWTAGVSPASAAA